MTVWRCRNLSNLI